MDKGLISVSQKYSKTNQVTGAESKILRFLAPPLKKWFIIYLTFFRSTAASVIQKIEIGKDPLMNSDCAKQTRGVRYLTSLLVSNGDLMTDGEIRRIFCAIVKKHTGLDITFGDWRQIVRVMYMS
jgi:hypothetical protein